MQLKKADNDKFSTAAPNNRRLRGHTPKLFKPRCRTIYSKVSSPI